MAPPEETNGDQSFSEDEKQVLLDKIKLLEDSYTCLDTKHNELVQKYKEEVEKKADTGNPPQNSLSEATDVQTQITDTLKTIQDLAAEIRSSSSSRNKERIEELDQYGRRNILLLLKLIYPRDKYGIDFIEFKFKFKFIEALRVQ